MYSSSNMLRARKKDASFKPNRILDKKSSRGMLYENEELRLRTIHINDEVERGHHDIKKLKKENDHLKREIWYLRDEYEKMEQKFNKVISNQDRLAGENYGEASGGPAYEQDQDQGFAYDENGSYVVNMEDGSPPDHDHGQGTSQQIPMHFQRGSRPLSRKISAATTSESVNSMYSSEDEEMNFMLMIDDEGSRSASTSGTGNSFAGMQMQLQPQLLPMAMIQEQQQQPAIVEEFHHQLVRAEVEPLHPVDGDGDGHGNGMIPYADDTGYQSQPYHHFWHHMTSIPPELEDVKEESESTNTNNNTSPAPKVNGIGGGTDVSSPSPSPAAADAEAMQQISSPSPNPIIEITPATTPTQTSLNASRETVLESASASSSKEKTRTQNVDVEVGDGKNSVQDLGCFTLITEKFQATSQVKLSSDADGGDGDAEEITITNSQANSKDLSSQEIHVHTRTKSANAKCSTAGRRRGSALARGRRNSLHGRRGSAQSTQSQTLSFPNQGSGRLMSQSPFPFFYQSEPSIASGSLSHFLCAGTAAAAAAGFHEHGHCHGPQDDGSCSCSCRKYFDSSGRMNYQHRSSLGSGDKHVVIGYVEGCEGNAGLGLGSLGVKEIIDQLETQFDPKLENVASVRVMTVAAGANGLMRIFIVLKSASALKLLLEKGLSLNLSTNTQAQDAQHKIPIRLVDAVSESCTVVLVGLPPPPESLLLDTAIVSFLNQYGQVVGPLERRLYKGIDISECQIQMHLVRSLPPVLNVQGYEIQVQGKNCQKQEQLVHQPLSRTASASAYVSPSPAPSPNASPSVTPQQTPLPQAKGGHAHSGVQRSVSMSSTIPVLMSNGYSGLAPMQIQGNGKNRKIGICHDVLEEDLIQQLAAAKGGPHTQMHGGSAINLISSSQQQQQQQQQTSSAKKPLTRLPVSSPGNLAPEHQHQQYVNNSGIPTPGSGTLTSKPFYRSMSFDPRRNSNASRQGQEPGLVSGMGRLSVNEGPPSEGGPGTPAMMRRGYQNQMSTNSQMSQLERNGNGKLVPKHSTATTTASDAHKPLPWCGCWGNGCL